MKNVRLWTIACAGLVAIGVAGAVLGNLGGRAPDASAHEARTAAPVAAEPSATPDPSMTPDPSETSRPENPESMRLSSEVISGALAIRDAGPTRYPDVFAGMATGWDGVTDMLDVFLTRLDPSTEQDILQFVALPADKVTFHQATLTLSAARQLSDRVNADIEAGTLAHVYERGLMPDGTVQLSFTDDATAGVDENAFVSSLQERYGPGLEVKLHVPYVAYTAIDPVTPPLPVVPGADG